MVSETVEVALAEGSEALAALVTTAGARSGGDWAEVLLVDARADQRCVADAEAIAATARQALLAIVSDQCGAAAAYEAGATHVSLGDPTTESLTLALRFAGRYARRLRGTGRMRRAGEAVEGAVTRFIGDGDPAEPATVALVAITRFDTVNAAFGREAGDQLLRQAAARLAAVLPPSAVIERDHGARFVIAVREGGDAARARVAAIEGALGRGFTLGCEEARLGVRIGVAHREAGEPARSLVTRATEALANAAAGDGANVRFAPRLHVTAGLDLAADLHRAIDRREIDILFQPQVMLDSGRITGVEALARWEHPVHGVLGANTLFSAADRAGLGLALSEHIQLLALTRAAAWQGQLAALRVAVNVTAADLARSDFVTHFLSLVERSGIAPSRVTAEVTESGFVTDLPLAAERLEQLRARGLRIAIDDFGTGYSSLAYLKALPLDYLKVDRSLTKDIAGAPRARVVVRGILDIAAGLGLQTIAEGVENARERDLLAAEGCTLYQGFLCAGPLDERALKALVEGHRQ
ncbi:bifunctional diguanylate cyclase/phosphodiesterase [Sphingomonas sp. IC4-52]|uniref:EAL domain-containing protein n=1 Tax=Sphingomonas sp. IC4-52 TaxID=2887202 RepID=UPI001D10B6DC|nr:bifunctional diguanylate cyclase/phosphodiesterase [Sphingomonas sp. IC4-52]MCC2979564.1 bifunctional diguanylate cyclase/phosphodiesterase [Sphingomonas sp. IC4-52]